MNLALLAFHTNLWTSAAPWPVPPLPSPPCPCPPYSGLVGLEGRGVHMGPSTGGEGQAGEAPSWELTQMNRPEGEANACSPHCHPRASD